LTCTVADRLDAIRTVFGQQSEFTQDPAAAKYLNFDGHPSQIYVRTIPNDQAVTTVAARLRAAQANPENPGQVTVSQPSDALTAQADAKGALDTCSSAWARSRCWSARSGWPTSWSSRCSNAARRSVCAGHWAPPAARSASSSWPRPSCCPWPAAWPRPSSSAP
jgi:putative ABC transport system permease protein